jgi:hypothetical protein
MDRDAETPAQINKAWGSIVKKLYCNNPFNLKNAEMFYFEIFKKELHRFEVIVLLLNEASENVNYNW